MSKQGHLHCDYFKFSVPHNLTTEEINTVCKELFGEPFNRFEQLYGSREGYKRCYSFGGIIHVFRDGYMKNAGTTVFELSGTAMKYEKIDIKQLCQYVVQNDGNVCRLDVTADDIAGTIPYAELVELSTIGNFKSRVKTKLCRNRKDEDGNIIEGYPTIKLQPQQIQYGLPSSDNYITVYCHDGVLRVELRLRHREDTRALAEEIALDTVPLGELFAGVIRRRLDFLQDNGKRKDRNSTVPWWDSFLGGVAARKITRRTKPKNPNVWTPSTLQKAYKLVLTMKTAGDHESLDHLQHLVNHYHQQIQKLEHLPGNTYSYFPEFSI